MDNNQPKRSDMNGEQTKNVTVDYEGSLADWWEAIGLTPTYPTDLDTVERLLAAMDFELPTGGLAYLEAVGQLAFPGDEWWEASDIVHLAGACQALEWFRREPDSIHWHRLSRYQRARVQAKAEGTDQALISDFAKFSLRHLLILLRNAPNKDLQDQVFASLEAKLEAEGIT